MQSTEPVLSSVNELGGFLRLLGNPLRLEILFYLLKGPCCVCELAEKLDHRQPCISQHLMLLRKKKLVNSRHEGWKRSYFITSEKLKNCLEYMQANWLATNETLVSPTENDD